MSAIAQPHRPIARSARPRLVLVPTGEEAERAARAARPQLRVTRRGRIAVTLAVLVVLAGLTLVGSALASGDGAARSVTVQEGQTLSQIAISQLPELPVSEAVVELQLANGLSSSHVHAGQTLVVPVL